MLLVDDHPLMRRGINQLLSFEDEFTVVAESSNRTDAVAQNHEYKPDLILLDLNMKGMSGLDTLKALRADECDAMTGARDSSNVCMLATLDGWDRSIMMPHLLSSAMASRPRSLRPSCSHTPSPSPVLESESWLWPLCASDM